MYQIQSLKITRSIVFSKDGRVSKDDAEVDESLGEYIYCHIYISRK